MCSCEDWDETGALRVCAACLSVSRSDRGGSKRFLRCCRKASQRRGAARSVSASRHGQSKVEGAAWRRDWRRLPAAARFRNRSVYSVVVQPEEICDRHAGRGLRRRKQRRRHHPAGEYLVAHNAGRVQLGTGGGGRCAWRPANYSLLAWRGTRGRPSFRNTWRGSERH